MFSNKASSLLFAYFEQPVKEYVRTLQSIIDSGGLSNAEIDVIRANAPEFHVEAMLRHLAATRK